MALRVWLPLNGNLNNYGLSGTTFITETATVDNNGKIGKCYNFLATTGNGIYLNSSSMSAKDFMTNYINNHSWTLCAWFITSSTISLPIFGITYGIRMYVGASNSILLYNSSRTVSLSANMSTNDNEWHHIAASYNVVTNQISIYIDGVLKNTAFYTSGYTYSSSWSNSIYIGRDPNNSSSSYFFNGKLNDVRIYDHCLSPKEVYELSKGLIIHYKLNYEPIEETTNISSQYSWGGWDNSGTATRNYNDTSIPNIPESHGRTISITQDTEGLSSITFGGTISNVPSKTLTASVWFYMSGDITNVLSPYIRSAKTDGNLGNLIYNGTTSISNWPKNTWIRLTKTITTNDNVTTIYFCAYTSKAGCKFVFNGWLIEEKDHATPYTPSTRDSVVYDCSGYQNNGAITGEFSILPDSKRYSSSIKYLNSDTSIAIGNLSQLCPAGIFTFNIWFKKNTGEWSTKTWETILGGPSGFELETKISSSSSSYIHPYSWGGNSSGAPNNYSIPYTLDEWHMLTMVRTSSYSKFYLDGELKLTSSAGSIPSGNYFLGAWYTATQQNYRGYLSDFRIYATELSESDILSLYQTSASIDNQQNFYSYEIEDNSTEYSGGLINSGEIFDLTFRATNNSFNVLKDVDTCLAHLQSVQGNTVSWNSLVRNGDFSNVTYWSASNGTISASDNILTYTIETPSNAMSIRQGDFAKNTGHKFYFKMDVYYPQATREVYIGCAGYWGVFGNVKANVWTSIQGIVEDTGNAPESSLRIYLRTLDMAVGDTIKLKNVAAFDLTLIYGAGNEPTSVEQFEADYQKWFGKPLTYEPYNAGELIPAKTTALKTTGFNQWDEEWEIGVYDSIGKKTTNSQFIRTNNFILVNPATDYYFKCPTSNARVFFYDGLQVFINSDNTLTNKIFTPPNNCRYITFFYYREPNTAYNHDVCINISSTFKNGTYEPYEEEHTLQLPLTTLTGKLNGAGESVVVFPYGMKKAGSVQDEIYISGGKTYAVKRVGSVDLGSLNWTYHVPYFQTVNVTPAPVNGINNICAKYKTTSLTLLSRTMDKTLGVAPLMYCVDSSYSDATSFKAAMQDVMLYYELAEPLVYELDDFALPATFRVNDYGTEEQISNTTSIPAELLISYDIKDKISLIGNETIYGDMVSIESGTYNYSYKYEVVGSNNLFLIGLEYYDTNRNLLSTANQVSSTGALSEKVISGNVSIPANTKYVRYKIVNDANNNSASNTSTIYFISLRLDTANPLLIYSTGESICNEFIELDQTSIHDSGITETNNIYEI